jgi:hypothetical protein
MHSAKILERDVQRDGGKVAINLFTEAVGQPRKPL